MGMILDNEDDKGEPTESIRDSLASTLAKARAEQDEGDGAAPAQPRPKPAAAVEGDEDKGAGKEADARPKAPKKPFAALEMPDRDETGRFRKTAAETAEAERQQPKEEATADKAPATPSEKTPEQQRAEAITKGTANFSAEDKEMFGKLPADAQDFIIRRHNQMLGDYTRQVGRLRGFVDEYGPIDQMLQPYAEQMRAAKMSPRTVIEGWANAEKAFMSGGDNALKMLVGLADGYKMDRAAIVRALGYQVAGDPAPGGRPNGQGNGHDPVFRDPRVDEILAERQRQQQDERLAAQQRIHVAHAQAQREVDAFRNETDTAGRLLRPYYDEVEEDMVALYDRASKKGGKPPSLQDLYEDAVGANRSTREKIRAAERQSEEQKRSAELRGKAERARNAGSSVTGAPRKPSHTPPPDIPAGASLRDTLRAAKAAMDAADEG